MDKEIKLLNNLKKVRQERKISQEELAKLSGITRQTIIAIEKGQFNPSTKLALILSTLLEVKVENLFYIEKN